MRPPVRIARILVFGLSATLLTAAASFDGTAAPTEPTFRISENLEASELVFHGTVIDVEYREAKDGTPHAFVTYQVKQIIRGELSDHAPETDEKKRGKDHGESQVTLRFIGGPRGDGTYFMVSIVPNFAEGDDDILFVSANGTSMCPLVRCPNGRFRVVDGGIYQGAGTPVVSAFEDVITARGPDRRDLLAYRFPAPSFEKLYEQPGIREFYEKLEPPATFEELKKAYETYAADQIIMQPRDQDSADRNVSERPAIDPISVEAFLDVLVTQAANLPKQPPVFTSVDPEAPFETGLTAPAEPPAIRPRPQRQRLPADPQRLDEYRSDDFNPVVK